jgi:hypothetical protein
VGTTKAGGGLTGSILRIAGRHHGAGASGGSGKAWSFRARSREEMMEWWNDLRMLCARFLVASEQMERSGPVAAAVRSAGYPSESDEEEEEEEGDERSSGEGEAEHADEDKDDEEDLYEDARTEPPVYVQHGTNAYHVRFFLPNLLVS